MRPDKRPFGSALIHMIEIPPLGLPATEMARVLAEKQEEVKFSLRESVCATCLDCPRLKMDVKTYQEPERHTTVVRGNAKCFALTGITGCPDSYDPAAEKWIVKQESPAYWEEVPKTPVVVHTEEPPENSWGHLSAREIKGFMNKAKSEMTAKGFGAVGSPDLISMNIELLGKKLYHNSLNFKPVTEKVKKSLDEAFDRPSQDLPTTEGFGSW